MSSSSRSDFGMDLVEWGDSASSGRLGRADADSGAMSCSSSLGSLEKSNVELKGKSVVSVASYSGVEIAPDLATVVTCSSDVELSMPSGIPIGNPRSILTIFDITRIRVKFGFPCHVRVRQSLSHERADWDVPGYFSMYELPFRDGLRFPLPRLCRVVLKHWQIAPSQLMPNSWRILIGLEVLSWIHSVQYGLQEFLYTYFLKEHDRDKGRMAIANRPNRQKIITDLKTNDRGWKERFLFVDKIILGDSGISTSWSIPDKNRNIQSVVGLNIRERTEILLSKSKKGRSWRHLLSDRVLESTPLRNVDPTDEEAMRKAALAIDPEDDNFARKREKLLERKRKRESKGKAIVEDEPTKGHEVEANADVEVAGRRWTQLEVPPMPSQAILEEEKVQIVFPIEGSFFSEPKGLLEEARKFLLPEDEKRYMSLGHRKSAERNLLHVIQALQGTIHMEKELVALSKKSKEAINTNHVLKKDLDASKAEVDSLYIEKDQLERKLALLEKEKSAEAASFSAEISKLKSELARSHRKIEKLADEKENCELAASTAVSYKLMREFIEHKGERWDPEKIIRDYEELQELEQDLSAEHDMDDEDEETELTGKEIVDTAGDDTTENLD